MLHKQLPLLLSLLLLLLCEISWAQHKHNPEAIHFRKEAKEKSKALHAQYPKAANVQLAGYDNDDAKFAAIDQAWHDLWGNFTEYYHGKGLYFEKKHKVFVHLHFSETGHLDYFGYNFKGKHEAQEETFVTLFREYIESHDFGLNPGIKFSQCGELHLLPRVGIQEGM